MRLGRWFYVFTIRIGFYFGPNQNELIGLAKTLRLIADNLEERAGYQIEQELNPTYPIQREENGFAFMVKKEK